MLKKMRWHFISAAMIAFFIVVIGLLCIINVWNYGEVAKGKDEIIQTIIKLENDRVPSKPRPPIPPMSLS